MQTWPTRVGLVLSLLDPAVSPRLMLDRVWQEVLTWNTIAGIWLHCRPGHLQPSGIFQAGQPIEDVEEIAALATPVTAPINTDGLPVVARQVRDGNVPVATLLVSHHDSEEATAFIVDALSRYLVDRLRLQLEVSELTEENAALRLGLSPQVREHHIVTCSGVMEGVIQTAARAAASTATVLIQGETGTGKELLAKLIHSHSPRSTQPMVSINAGALPPTLLESELFGHVQGAFTGAEADRKGLFEIAQGGTIFLDEVAELSVDAQVRMLRVLQDRTVVRLGDHRPRAVDVRIIAATHRDLEAEVGAGRFRQDLYYRLNVVTLVVPPLRDRPEDIPPLVNHFLQIFNRENYKNVDVVPRRVLDMLQAYPWPGNVRELENCIHKVVVLAKGKEFLEDLVPPVVRSYGSPVVEGEAGDDGDDGLLMIPRRDIDLSATLSAHADREGPDLARFMQQAERILITYALNREKGVKLRAAKLLGINRVTLDRKLAEYHIQVRRGQGVIDDEASEEE